MGLLLCRSRLLRLTLQCKEVFSKKQAIKELWWSFPGMTHQYPGGFWHKSRPMYLAEISTRLERLLGWCTFKGSRSGKQPSKTWFSHQHSTPKCGRQPGKVYIPRASSPKVFSISCLVDEGHLFDSRLLARWDLIYLRTSGCTRLAWIDIRKNFIKGARALIMSGSFRLVTKKRR